MMKLETEAELVALHTGNVKEGLHLEYKASDAINKKDDKTKIEMARDVSAFANADGGQVVYGMAENKDHEPNGLDAGIDPKAYPEIWFETVLQQHVTPKLEGLICKHVPLSTGRVAVVLSVPRTQGDPHQVSEGRYFRRHSFNRLPMEHYEIRDAFNRQTAPSLFIETNIREQHKQLQFENPASTSGLVTLELCIGNRANTPAMYTAVHLYIDERLVVQSSGSLQFFGQAEGWKIYTKKIGLPHGFPIFKEQLFTVTEQGFNVGFPHLGIGRFQSYNIKVRIFCPGFSGDQHWQIHQIENQISIEEIKLRATVNR